MLSHRPNEERGPSMDYARGAAINISLQASKFLSQL